MKKLFVFITAAVAASATLPAVADTWTDPSTGIEPKFSSWMTRIAV